MKPMKQVQQVTAIIEREGDGYVALCPELDVASRLKLRVRICRRQSSFFWKLLIRRKSTSADILKFLSLALR